MIQQADWLLPRLNLGQAGRATGGDKLDLHLNPQFAFQHVAIRIGMAATIFAYDDQVLPALRIAYRLANPLSSKGRHVSQHGSNSLWENVNPAQLDHIVRPAEESLNPLEIDPDGAGVGAEGTDIMGIEADDRIHIILEQTGDNQIAGLPIGDRLTRFKITNLNPMGVFHHDHDRPDAGRSG